MLAILEARGAEYPAEHNVGHLYQAKPPLKAFYQQLDPTNRFNPGIGKTTRAKTGLTATAASRLPGGDGFPASHLLALCPCALLMCRVCRHYHQMRVLLLLCK